MIYQRASLSILLALSAASVAQTGTQSKSEKWLCAPEYKFDAGITPTDSPLPSPLLTSPNDPLYPSQWHYASIQLPGAWAMTRGNQDTCIAVLDSGRSWYYAGNFVDHPDLEHRWARHPKTGAILERNAVRPGNVATTITWAHGNFVAGLIGAQTNNNVGGAGICNQCKLLNVKVDDDNLVQDHALDDGIQWATDQGARVINLSMSALRACSSVPRVAAAVQYALDHEVSVVAAAGNAGEQAAGYFPANCAGVISVAATDRSGMLSEYSNRGPGVTLTAPGGGGAIWLTPQGVVDPNSTIYGDPVGTPTCTGLPVRNNQLGVISAWTQGAEHCHRYMGGTSFAAPHVSGTIGLMLSVSPHLRVDQIRNLLITTATPIPGCGANCGAGLLNAQAAVAAAAATGNGPCSALERNAPCVLDSHSRHLDPSGQQIEQLFAYGYRWQRSGSGRLGFVKLKKTQPYASGPCQAATNGAACKLDTISVVDYPGFGKVESMTAYGRYWNFDAQGNALPGSGSSLFSVERYSEGPCVWAGSTCVFDTRTLIVDPSWGGLVESITAYGRYWNFQQGGALINSDSLLSVARYASGPCAWRPAGSTCRFDTRELVREAAGSRLETITAYGRYFEWRDGVATAQHGQLLTQLASLR